MLKAPSKSKNKSVKVVNTGAIVANESGVMYPNPDGPRVNPRTIKNNTSGILNFLNINSAKKPKNKIKLIAKRVNVTTSIIPI